MEMHVLTFLHCRRVSGCRVHCTVGTHYENDPVHHMLDMMKRSQCHRSRSTHRDTVPPATDTGYCSIQPVSGIRYQSTHTEYIRTHPRLRSPVNTGYGDGSELQFGGRVKIPLHCIWSIGTLTRYYSHTLPTGQTNSLSSLVCSVVAHEHNKEERQNKSYEI